MSQSHLRSFQVNLLSERLAVALFKSKSNPIDETKRRQIAELLIDQFDIRARWKEDRPVFGRMDEPVTMTQVDRLTQTEADNLQEEMARVATLEGEESSAVDPSEPSNSSATKSSVCSTCAGVTWLCTKCNLPEGSCGHIGKRVPDDLITCPTCGGTGREPE